MTRIGAEMAADNLELQRANTLWETDQVYWLYVSVQEKVKLAEAYEDCSAGWRSGCRMPGRQA